MKLTIAYSNDGSTIPFCASTMLNEKYLCAWSVKGYADAKADLLKKVHAALHPKDAPESEMVEVV